jgi:hypothetical protein
MTNLRFEIWPCPPEMEYLSYGCELYEGRRASGGKPLGLFVDVQQALAEVLWLLYEQSADGEGGLGGIPEFTLFVHPSLPGPGRIEGK